MSLKEKLLSRERPTTTVPLRVADDTDARRRLDEAEQALVEAQERAASPGTQAVRKARQARDEAQQAVDDCYADITVRAMPPAEFEALVAAHPAPAADENGRRPDGAAGDIIWDLRSFPRACFMECVVLEDGMSREDWEQVLDTHCSQAEHVMLFDAAMMINARRIDEIQVPKDWTAILNSLSS